MANLETLTDVFNGTTLDTGKWTTAGSVAGTGSVAIGGGVLTCTTGTSGNAGISSIASYTIANTSYLSAQIFRGGGSDYTIRLMVTQRSDGSITNGASYWEINSGNLECWAYDNAAGGGKLNTTTYSATYRWLRLAFTVSGNAVTTRFQYSTDGTTWNTTYTGPALTWTNATGYARIYTNSSPGSTSKTTTIDHINTSFVPDGGWSTTGGPGRYAISPPRTQASTFAQTGAASWQKYAGYATTFAQTAAAPLLFGKYPDSVTDPQTIGAPSLTFTEAPPTPNSIIDAETIGQPGIILPVVVSPGSAGDPETISAPAVDFTPSGSTPQSITDGETLDGPKISLGYATTPDHISDPETIGAPDLNFAVTYTPDTLVDYDALGAPAILEGASVAPAGILNTETIGSPWVGTKINATPDGIRDTQTFDPPTLTQGKTCTPASIIDVDTVGIVELAGPSFAVGPAEITDPEAFGGPALTTGTAYLPAEVTDPETLDGPAVQFVPAPPYPDGCHDAESIGAPKLRYDPSLIAPASIVDPGTLTAPALSSKLLYNGTYGSGDYGRGIYGGINLLPDGILDLGILGEPGIFTIPPVDPNTVLPLGIRDTETFGEPTLPRLGATNYFYGAGIYSEGVYYGEGATDDNPRDNLIYGDGTYGYGIYYGVIIPDVDIPPLFRDLTGGAKPALHIMGIGPWSPTIEWRGAPNYELGKGRYAARPAIALPPALSKGFTLRLGEGGEARYELSVARGSSIVVDEMDTDLWWRRKDPRTNQLEMIGRFNHSHVSLSTSDTGVTCSVQCDDYQTVLGARLVLKYLSPTADPPTTMWDKGTSVGAILQWALPDNTGLDLSALAAYDLGTIVQPYDLPPGTTIADLMSNMQAITNKPFEWWIETPVDINKTPAITFAHERGTDKGVVLFDFGSGPTPIASWTRQGSTDDYANSLYYTSGGTGTGKDAGGGVVEQFDADVAQYGQRDAQDGNFSIGGDIEAIRKRAHAKLQQLADRRPSYTIRLRQGFWRGRSHIDIGDTVTLILRLGKDKWTAPYRVSEITVDIDENNLEEVTLNLGRLPASADPRSRRSAIPRIIRYLKNYSAPAGKIVIDTD